MSILWFKLVEQPEAHVSSCVVCEKTSQAGSSQMLLQSHNVNIEQCKVVPSVCKSFGNPVGPKSVFPVPTSLYYIHTAFFAFSY